MACYNTLKNGGDADSSKSMLIHLYPNKSGDDNEAENAIANRLETACDSLLNDNQIGHYEIKISYDHPGLNSSGNIDLLNEWTDYYTSNGCNNSNFGSRTGAHCLVSGQIGNGVAQSAGENGVSAFGTSLAQVTGTGYGVKEYFANIAIQEVLHSFIKPLGEVEKLYDNEGEHALGKIYGWGKASPMITSYENSHKNMGDCGTKNSFNQQYNPKPTSCTRDAVGLTADDDS